MTKYLGIKRLLLCAAACAATVALPARADSDMPAGHVTVIASDQLFNQSAVIFKLDTYNGDCAASQYLSYHSTSIDTLKAIYATVLGAYLSGTPLLVTTFTGSCTVKAI